MDGLVAAEVGTLRIGVDGRLLSVDEAATAMLPRARPGAPAAELGLDVAHRLRDPAARHWIHRTARTHAPEIMMMLGPADEAGRVLFVAKSAAMSMGNDETLIALDRLLADEIDPARILIHACGALGRALGVQRVGYGEIDASDRWLCIDWDWVDGVASMVGRHPIVEDAAAIIAHRRGEPVIVEDARALPGVSAAEREALDRLEIVASAGIPLMRDGRWVAHVCAMANRPRAWREDEVRLIAAVGERTWQALAHARAIARSRESEALLHALVHRAPIGVYVEDEGGTMLLANGPMRTMQAQPGWSADRRDPDGLSVERRIGDRWSLATRFPLPTGASSAPLIAGFEINLTALKHAQEEIARTRDALHQVEKLNALGSLLSGISHELNNPLSIVIAQAELLERKAGDGPAAGHARKVRAAAERCGRIVAAFLAMARQRPQDPQPTDVNAALEGALDLVAHPFRGGGIRVTRALATGLPPALIDPDHLRQLLATLLVNAQQALAGQDAPREVRVCTRGDGAELVIEIADNGPGIAPDLRSRVFEPFFTTRDKAEGGGMGLAFARGLAEAAGGSIVLDESDAGAAFSVRLPIAPVPDRAPAPRPDGMADVLIVDDEPDIADAMAEYLALDGLRCDVVADGTAATERLKERDYDAIVADIRMPGLDGPGLAAWIDHHRPHLARRLAFVTGDRVGARAAAFLTASGRPSIEKPFTPERLRALVAGLAA